MSERDPDRLTGSTDDPRLRDLLEAGQKELPDEAQLARMAAKLGPIIGDGGGGGGAAGRSHPPGVAWTAAAKIVGVVAVVTAAGWVGSSLQHKADGPHVAPVSTLPFPAASPAVAAAEQATPEESPPPASAVAAPTSRPLAKPIATSATREPTSASGESDPEAEVKLLEAAEDALVTTPAVALARADESAHRFPRGLLRQEAEVIAIDALVRLGRHAAAQQRANSFRQTYPTSGQLQRIDAILARDH